jgi:2-iminobutanoate/2-iminopropanoate deaminase
VNKTVIAHPGVPPSARPFGSAPLSAALAAGPFVFVSGQVGIDPLTGKVAGGDVQSQTRQTLRNMAALLQAGGLSMADVVKTTVFLTRIGDFDAMNQVYREFFAEPYPTRSTVGIALANPELLVEIEGIALRRSGQA